jgi:hypothetical protein
LLGLLRFIEARRSIGWVLNIFAIHWVIVIRPKDK